MVSPLWETVWHILTKLKHILVCFASSKHTPWYSPEGAESLCPHKNLTQIFSNFIHNCQNLEATKMPFSASVGQRLNKLWYIQTMRYYLVPQRKELPSHEKTWKKLNAHCWVKGPNQERLCMYHMVPTIWHPGQQTMETVKQTVTPSIWLGGADSQAEHSRVLGRWDCSVGQHSGGSMPLHFCSSPQNVRHQEGTLR